AQRLAEETVEQRPRRSERVGGANLPQDLRLATNARVEPGGDAEEVPGGLVVRAPVKGAIDVAENARRPLLRARPGDVELRPVAGREANCFALVPRELSRELGRFIGGERPAAAPLRHRSGGRPVR